MPGKMSAEHEKLWNEAKSAAAKEGQHGNWAYVQGVFQKMVKGGHKPAAAPKPKMNLANAARKRLASMRKKPVAQMPERMEEAAEKMGKKGY